MNLPRDLLKCYLSTVFCSIGGEFPLSSFLGSLDILCDFSIFSYPETFHSAINSSSGGIALKNRYIFGVSVEKASSGSYYVTMLDPFPLIF